MDQRKRILICRPNHFSVQYEINAWMNTRDKVDPQTASAEWERLYAIYCALDYDVKVLDTDIALPDLVFAADSSLIIDRKVMMAAFRHRERYAETGVYQSWLDSAGYADIHTSTHVFEGGDALVFGTTILAGHGFRSEIASHAEIARFFHRPVISLKLINPYYYHMDTALAVLDASTVAYYPGAFDRPARRIIEKIARRVIVATAEEASGFGLNAISDGTNVITSATSESLLEKYSSLGYTVHGTDVLEFRKAGGGVRCLTLELS